MRLGQGIALLPGNFRSLQATFFANAQNEDGGFSGRDGGSDLYYTTFALRSLAILGELNERIATHTAAFLRKQLARKMHIVDFVSLMFGASLLEMAAGVDVFSENHPEWCSATTNLLEELRRSDGGYAKAVEGAASSTYQTFLNVLAYQILESKPPEQQRLVDFVLSQQREDGGFAEIRASKRSGTNPTAAAIGLLKIASSEWNMPATLSEVKHDTAEFLAEMQTDEGGLRANTRIPIADLLSTFTGMLTLADLGEGKMIDRIAARKFVQSLANNTGGFHAAAWDEAVDVEYSFYGLGALALLASEPSSE